MSSEVMEQINALSEEWHGCYEELRALAESRVGENWHEASAPTRQKLRQVEGELLRLWAARRCEKRAGRA